MSPNTLLICSTGLSEFSDVYGYRIFAVHADYGLTLTLGVALLLKYMFVDRHYDLLEVKHAIDLQKAMSAVDMETQTEEYVEEEGMVITFSYSQFLNSLISTF